MVRRQPTWLHRVAQHHVFPLLLKTLKSEADLGFLVPGLLVLVSLLPAVSAKLGPHLAELFEVFGRLAALSWREGTAMGQLSSTHLTVALYAYFHRLYGMFPCNFLSWLRTVYPEQSSSSGVFSEVVAPLLDSVRLHPLLVTQSRDQERTPARWRGLAEVHEVVAECSRYSLDPSETREVPASPLLPLPRARPRLSIGSKLVLDSPPEAAIEATPDNTPYVTPIKDFSRPGTSRSEGVRHVQSLSFRSPTPCSPSKVADTSPFRWPEVGGRGEDAMPSELPASALSKRDSLGLGLASTRPQKEQDSEHEPGKFKEKLQTIVSQETESRDTDAEVSRLTASVPQRGEERASPRSLSSLVVSPREDRRPPSTSVEELVARVRTRVRCITLCEQEQALVQPAKLARTLSCPSLHLQQEQAGEPPVFQERGKLRFTSGTQTEPSLALLPYEHLFPLALPDPPPAPPPAPRPDPQAALDSYLTAAVVEDGIIGIQRGEGSRGLQAELKLLHSQLQFEVGRREVLGARNRRLLGVSKGVREMEEKQLSLEDQLRVVRSEVTSLHAQLATVRQSKHQCEQERAEGSRVQEAAIHTLQARVQELELTNRQVEERVQEKERVTREALAECDQARGQLFQAKARLESCAAREVAWGEARKEAESLRKQLVVQGELVERFRERLEQLPVAGREQEIKMIQEAARHEVEKAKADLIRKSQDLTCSLAQVEQLEGRVSGLESALTSQVELVGTVQGEATERMAVAQERYTAMRSVNIQLEGNVMELQDRLERLARSKRGGRQARTSQSTECLELSVGPGSSLVGSQGSEGGEYLGGRPGAGSPPVLLGREVSLHGSAPVGSAVSALQGYDRGREVSPFYVSPLIHLSVPTLPSQGSLREEEGPAMQATATDECRVYRMLILICCDDWEYISPPYKGHYIMIIYSMFYGTCDIFRPLVQRSNYMADREEIPPRE